jgi:hypothetical protein
MAEEGSILPADDAAADARWTRLVAEWFEEQARLVIAELESPRPAGDPATADAKRSTSRD